MSNEHSELIRKMGEALGVIAKGFVELADKIGKEKSHDSDATGGKKRKRAEKDPDAPKRPKNGYLLYVAEKMAERHTDPDLKDLKQAEVMTALGAKWKALPEDEKKPYQEQAKVLLDAYTEEKARYAKEHVAGSPSPAGGAGASSSSAGSAAKKARAGSDADAGSASDSDSSVSETDEASSSDEEPAIRPKPQTKPSAAAIATLAKAAAPAPAPAPAPKPVKVAAPAPAPAPAPKAAAKEDKKPKDKADKGEKKEKKVSKKDE